ncbi:MAG: isoaspartyl peptidase/L-asparaginase [Candidatus Odinarchaeota archaeon]|nr:isoaspartyl peptidase/L-asparaginase [Candidatus Odinarchaeota archaeon]
MHRIVVHGGAGRIKEKYVNSVLKGVSKAAEIGYEILKSGGIALDAVEAAVKELEENPVFNAGYGSALNINGHIEMDAAIMDGRTLNCGAVALAKRIKYPISLARIIMEKTDHVLIAGDFLEKLANKFKIPLEENLISPRSREKWMELKDKFSKNNLSYLSKNYKLLKEMGMFFDTVGAVAIDSDGNLAAATSTGGLTLKLPGRIGDTPLIGCGTYADNEGAAISATGIGEHIVKLAVACRINSLIIQGLSPTNAIKLVFEVAKRRISEPQFGVIVIDRNGEIGIGHLTKNLGWAVMTEKDEKVRAGIKYNLS